MHPNKTDELLKLLNSASTLSDLTAYNDATQQQTPAVPFHNYMADCMTKKSMTTSQLIQNAQIQRNYGYQILNGTKNPGRDKVISLCLALSLSLDETQRALTLAKECSLYAKNKRDAVLIFAINKQLSVLETNDLLYHVEEKILE